jgi:hypothetical protein
MEESAQAATSYVRSRLDRMGITHETYQKVDVHIHFPDFVRKDGPSAGVTMVTALVSALMKAPVRHDLAMTGEITLRGRVMPIGGLKEKLLAAHRGGIKTVVMPKENRKDLREVPRRVLRALRLVLVEHVDDVLREALIVPGSGRGVRAAEGDARVPRWRAHRARGAGRSGGGAGGGADGARGAGGRSGRAAGRGISISLSPGTHYARGDDRPRAPFGVG